jgi:hypothetical protein
MWSFVETVLREHNLCARYAAQLDGCHKAGLKVSLAAHRHCGQGKRKG